MVNTVAVLGHNGLLGKPTLTELIALDQAGEIKLVVIHRAGSNTETIPKEIEKRVLDLSAPDGPEYDKALEGVNIVLSLVGPSGIPSQGNLIPALKRSKEVQTFIPSEFGAAWTQQDIDEGNLGFVEAKEEILNKFKDAGIPVTFIHAGGFTELIVNFPFVGLNVKGNSVWQYQYSDKQSFPLCALGYTAKTIAAIVTRDAATIANKTYHGYELAPTWGEMAQTLTELHGKPTEIITISDADLNKKLKSTEAGGYEGLGASIFKKVATGSFVFPGVRVEVPGWKGLTIEETFKRVLEQ